MLKIDNTSFGFGVLVSMAIAGIVIWVIDHRRHSCMSCSRKTRKTCRIFTHQMDPETPTGFRKVSVYVFRECSSCSQVRVHIIDKLMPTHVLNRKPDIEREFSSLQIRRLFELTPHVRNPVSASFMIRQHLINRHEFRLSLPD
jgi:hypothetical protein